MEAAWASKMLVSNNVTTQHYKLEDHNLNGNSVHYMTPELVSLDLSAQHSLNSVLDAFLLPCHKDVVDQSVLQLHSYNNIEATVICLDTP